MLTLNKVFSMANSQSVAYVRDKDIHYMVINTQLNSISSADVNKISDIIKTVEQFDFPGVFVTLTTPEIFSSETCSGLHGMSTSRSSQVNIAREENME